MTNKTRPFISRPHNYEANLEDSRTGNVRPALLDNPDGGLEPAVAIFASGRLKLILTPAGALNLANQIADTIEELEGRAAA